MRKLLFALLLLPVLSFAQGTTTQIRHGGTLPTTCVGGDIFIKTGSSSGQYYNLVGGSCSWIGPLGTSTATVTNTGTLTSGKTICGNGGVDITTCNPPYIVAAYVTGTQTNSQVFVRHVPSVAVTVPSGCTNSTLTLEAAATSSTTYTIKKNGSSVGTAVVSSSGTSGTFTCASSFSFNGTTDVLTVSGPSTADATAAGFTLSLYGTR